MSVYLLGGKIRHFSLLWNGKLKIVIKWTLEFTCRSVWLALSKFSPSAGTHLSLALLAYPVSSAGVIWFAIAFLTSGLYCIALKNHSSPLNNQNKQWTWTFENLHLENLHGWFHLAPRDIWHIDSWIVVLGVIFLNLAACQNAASKTARRFANKSWCANFTHRRNAFITKRNKPFNWSCSEWSNTDQVS